MTDVTLTRRLARGETKSTAFFFDADDPLLVAKTVCGLLNSEGGGVVYVGVDKNGRPTGRSYTEQHSRTLESALQKEISPAALYSVSVDASRAGDILTIDVPAGSDRPYVVAGAVWIREGADTRPAVADDIRAMFADAEAAVLRWERRISTAMNEDDLDLELVGRVSQKAVPSGRLFLEEAETEMDVLRDLSYWRPKGFTNACDVVFAKHPARRHPQTRVQFLEFQGDKTDDVYEDYRWFEGPAIDVVEKVYAALQNHNRTRARFHEGSLERDEQPAYHDFPLREGIVNALAHRSYESYSGGVKISVYPDRIEVWNTGRLPPEIDIKDLPRKHQSYPVNPDIAHAFYMNGFMERTGRGTERIAEACKHIGAPKPVWTEDQGGVTLILYASLSPGEAVATQLNDRQRAFLDAVPAGETISLADYAARFAKDITKRQARRELAELEDLRFVRKEGRSVATVYRRLKS